VFAAGSLTNCLRADAGVGNNYPFLTQKERDNETGLDYFAARYYSSTQGRFTSPDLFAGKKGNPQTLNRYSYVKNNPLKFIDPFGYSPQDRQKDCPNKDCINTQDDPVIVKINSEKLPWYKRALHAVGKFLGKAVESYGRNEIREAQDDMGATAATLSVASDATQIGREVVESNPQMIGLTLEFPFLRSVEGFEALDESAAELLDDSGALDNLLTAGVELPNAGGVIQSFVTEQEEIYYRVFSDNPVGGFLTKTPASSSAYARQALSLPPGNQATYIQEVVVPAGTRLQRSRALAVEKWGTRGGAEQFQLLDQIPFKNFGPPRRLQ
jgi:RHS repeat-associated protein